MEKEALIRKYYKLIKETYDLTNPKVMGKYRHSLNVAYLMSKYAPYIKADPDLAFTIGLLHDIGRFHQITTYHTFDDRKSIDHGDYALKILDNCDLFTYFDILPLYESIIKKAIYNHNKFGIVSYPISEEEDKQIKLLRDCDKLSILSEYVKVPIHEIKDAVSKEDEINPKIIQSIKNHTLNKYENVHNGLDEICYYISYIFDMNYGIIQKELLSYVYIILDCYKKDARFARVRKYIDEFKLERKKELC